MNLDTETFRKDRLYPVLVGRRAHGYGRAAQAGAAVVWRDTGMRSVLSIKAILIHTTNNGGGNTRYESEASFLRDSWDVSSGYVVSSHNRTVAQLLPDTMIAWHSGNCADNDFENETSIGIEIAWVPNHGPIPQIAIENTTALVQMLLQRYPSINKIDTHRRQAIPAGRKIDPSGWDDEAFYAWRNEMLNRSAPPITDLFAAWGATWPRPEGVAMGFAIPRTWLRNSTRCGECRGPEEPNAGGTRTTQQFQDAILSWDRASNEVALLPVPHIP